MNDNKDPIFYKIQIFILIVIYVLLLKSVGIIDVISRGTL